MIGWDLLLEYTAIVEVVAISVSGYLTFLLESVGVHVPAWMLGAPGTLDPTRAFAVAFDYVGLPGFAKFVAVGAIVGIFTVLFAFTLGASRVWFSMSRDGLLPGWFAKTNRNAVPHRPTWIVGVVAALIAGFTPILDAAELTNIGILLAFIVVSGAVIVLRCRSPDTPRTFRLPWMPVVPLVGIGFSIYLITKLQPSPGSASSCGS